MNYLYLKRREFIKLGAGVSLLGLMACSRGASNRYLLCASSGTLPKDLIATLPPMWKFEKLKTEYSHNPYEFALKAQTDLLALQDGWLDVFSTSDLSTIDFQDILPLLGIEAIKFIQAFSPEFHNKILPVGVSPWVMIFRNGDPWIETANETWEVLLDSRLKKQIILPNSPRLVISLAEKMGDLNKLQKLREQVKTYDDINGLNWILSGKARVAVLPLNRCINSLIRDPRLSIVLPSNGAPLNWTFFVKPISSKRILPLSWLKQSFERPLLRRLLNRGWLPPASYAELSKERSFLRKDLQSVIVPSRKVWDNCWSLLPLSSLEKKDLAELWINSTP
tara:strand:- start:475 stop:1482 length:1008 start_codon:yes stop_codon:yes gene_type:complete